MKSARERMASLAPLSDVSSYRGCQYTDRSRRAGSMNGRRYGMPERAALRPLYPTDPSWIEAQQSGLIASPCLLSNGVHTGFSRHTINDHLGKSITLQSTKRSSATR